MRNETHEDYGIRQGKWGWSVPGEGASNFELSLN